MTETNTTYRDVAAMALEVYEGLDSIRKLLDALPVELELRRYTMQALGSTQSLISEARALDKGQGI